LALVNAVNLPNGSKRKYCFERQYLTTRQIERNVFLKALGKWNYTFFKVAASRSTLLFKAAAVKGLKR